MMRFVTSGIAVCVLLTGTPVASWAQSATVGVGNDNQTQGGTTSGNPSPTGMTAGMTAGVTAGTGAGPGVAPGSAGTGNVRSSGSVPALNTMRANGTSLNQNPDPRVPNMAGRPAPPR